MRGPARVRVKAINAMTTTTSMRENPFTLCQDADGVQKDEQKMRFGEIVIVQCSSVVISNSSRRHFRPRRLPARRHPGRIGRNRYVGRGSGTRKGAAKDRAGRLFGGMDHPIVRGYQGGRVMIAGLLRSWDTVRYPV